MPVITRDIARSHRICDWERFTGSPAYDPEQDALVYPDEISDALLDELAEDRDRLMWLVNHGLITCDYMRARKAIRARRERLAQEALFEKTLRGALTDEE